MAGRVHGRDLRQARIDAGVKQAALEQALGIHHALMSAIENEQEGVQPSPDFAQRYLVGLAELKDVGNGVAA